MASSTRDNSEPRSRRRQSSKRSSNSPLYIVAAVGAVIVVGLVATVAYFVFAGSYDSRLIGTWKSQADATIQEMRKTRPVTDQQEVGLRKIFGHMTITYTKSSYSTELNGVLQSEKYTVVSKDGDSVIIKAKTALNGQIEQIRIQFVDRDTYWVETSGIRECFKRIR